MKLTALRVREVGCFAKPVALEGFSGKLDLFVGSNEAGKSTLVSALKMVFTEKYASKKKDVVGKLVPYSGGAPLIEVDFETAQNSWRLRKQFLSAPSARLLDLKTGEVVARNTDVETRLRKILHKDGRETAPLNLFWLNQQAPLMGAPIGKDDQSRLRDVIGREVTAVVDGGEAQAVREIVEGQLNKLATKETGKPKANGEWARRNKEQAAAREALNLAQERQAEAQQQLQKLADIEQRMTTLRDPDAERQRAETLQLAAKTLAVMESARAKRQIADAENSACRSALEIAETAKTDFEKKLAALKSIDEAIAVGIEAFARERDEATRVGQAFDKAVAAHAAYVTDLAEARRIQEVVAKAENLARDKTRHDELLATVTTVDALTVKEQELANALRDNRATVAAIDALERETKAIESLKARLTASAPVISVSYLPSVSERLALDGRPLDDGENVHITAESVVEIPDLGDLTITPSGSDEDAQEDQADLSARRDVRAEVLHKIGAPDVASARELAQARADLERRLGETQARLSVLTPNGSTALREEVARLAAIFGADGDKAHGDVAIVAREHAQENHHQKQHELDGDLPTLDEAVARVRLLEMKVVEASAELEKKRSERDRVSARVERYDARLQELKNQQAQLDAGLPETAARERNRASLQEKVVAAQSALAVSQQNLSDVGQQAGDELAFQKTKAAHATAESSIQSVRHELTTLQMEKTGLEAALAVGEQQGIAAHYQECREKLQRAEERAEQIGNEVAALTMLVDQMKAVEQLGRDRFLQPVLDGLRPYLDEVFPGAGLRFSEDLLMADIVRDDRTESLDRLSDGTREQLAILTRLGFGAVFARAGQPIPLVLDDPLAFADDDRLQRMFKALNHASEFHQVFVLSCRAQAFSTLKGRNLKLAPWQPEAGS